MVNMCVRDGEEGRARMQKRNPKTQWGISHQGQLVLIIDRYACRFRSIMQVRANTRKCGAVAKREGKLGRHGMGNGKRERGERERKAGKRSINAVFYHHWEVPWEAFRI